MADQEQKERSWRDKYRITITNDNTFEKVWMVRLKKHTAFLLVASLLLFIVGGTVSLIAFTNLREYIPGYPDAVMRRDILMNTLRLDSLEYEIELRDRYFQNINAIISGERPPDEFSMQEQTKTNSIADFLDSREDSLIRAMVENEDKFNLLLYSSSVQSDVNLANIHFFPHVRGAVTSSFDLLTGHYGTDLVSSPKSPVFAALDGTVIFTGWTMETGFVIALQHNNNLVSIYKHNSTLLKETGDLVNAGEPISFIGDSGELYTSGPHLHFEIWYNGSPFDPERYILF